MYVLKKIVAPYKFLNEGKSNDIVWHHGHFRAPYHLTMGLNIRKQNKYASTSKKDASRVCCDVSVTLQT